MKILGLWPEAITAAAAAGGEWVACYYAKQPSYPLLSFAIIFVTLVVMKKVLKR